MVCGGIKGSTDPERGPELGSQPISHPGMDQLSPPGSVAGIVAPLVDIQSSRHAGPGPGSAEGDRCRQSAAAAGSADGCDQQERAQNHQAPIAADDTTGDVGSKAVEACASAIRSLFLGEKLSTRHDADGVSSAAHAAAAAAAGEAGGIAASEGSSDKRVASSLVGVPTASSQTSTRRQEDEADVYDAPHCICSGAPVLQR